MIIFLIIISSTNPFRACVLASARVQYSITWLSHDTISKRKWIIPVGYIRSSATILQFIISLMHHSDLNFHHIVVEVLSLIQKSMNCAVQYQYIVAPFDTRLSVIHCSNTGQVLALKAQGCTRIACGGYMSKLELSELHM